MVVAAVSAYCAALLIEAPSAGPLSLFRSSRFYISVAKRTDWLLSRFKSMRVQYFQIVDLNFQRKGLTDGSKTDDNPALMTELRHYANGSGKNASSYAHTRPHRYGWMGPKKQTRSEAVPNFCEFLIGNQISFFVAQQAQHARGGDDRDSALRREPDKHVTGEERPLCDDSSVGPLYPFRVER
jgi:hypothetical protein